MKVTEEARHGFDLSGWRSYWRHCQEMKLTEYSQRSFPGPLCWRGADFLRLEESVPLPLRVTSLTSDGYRAGF